MMTGRSLADRCLSPTVVGWAALSGMICLPLVANPYLLFVGTQVSIFVILGVGLNILVGYCGQLAFSHAALFGIGAYAAGLLKVHLGWSFLIAVPVGAALACLIGTAIALPALRLFGLYLALATLAFAQFTQWVFLNWEKVTFGAGGFRVPRPVFGWMTPEFGTFYVALGAAVVLVVLAGRIIRSRFGRAIIAIRDGEVAAESLGIDLLRFKALAFGLSAFYAGVAGGLNAMTLSFVAPETYDLFLAVLLKAMIVLGGLGSIAGSALGAGIVLVLLEALRAVKSAQEIVFGAVLLACVLFAPAGLAGFLSGMLPSWRERYVGDYGARSRDDPAEPATAPTSPEPTSERVP
jgi:branched-chain amino acid transport system permease protein